MSEGPVRLLTADDLLIEPRVYLSVCGRVLTGADLERASCPGECSCELRYCQDGVAWVAGWNAELDADAASAGRDAGVPGE